MSLLVDFQIRKLSLEKGMITPYTEEQLSKEVKGVVSFGQSSCGYDIRLGNKFKVFDNWKQYQGLTIDPKHFEWNKGFTDYEVKDGETITIPPGSFSLAHSKETLKIPRNILAICLGKSTYARCGLIANVTPLEPEWEGQITIEISNTTPLPAEIYAGEGIIQVLFISTWERCNISYADKKGKYQGQRGITPATVKA